MPRGRRAELRLLRDTVWGDPGGKSGAAGTASTRARSAGVARFGIVGASGILVNEAAIAVLVSGLGLHYVVGYLLATQFSTLWNFAFIETWAFRSKSPTNRRWHRFVMLMLVNNAANLLSAPLYVAFTRGLGINYLVSNIMTLAVIFVGRFAIAERIWGGSGAATTTAPDAHDGVSDAVAELLQRHADTVAARAGGRRFATSAARRALRDALVAERTTLQSLGYDNYAQFLADAPPQERERAHHEELAELRARVEKLAFELADTLPPADDEAPRGAAVSSSRRERRGQPASGTHGAPSAKWFPAR